MTSPRRIGFSVVLDALVVLVLAVPQVGAYLRWPILALYVLLTVALARRLREQRWIWRIVGDPATRIAHGLEHATMAVLAADGLPVVHGFTHGTHRFMVAMEAGNGHAIGAVRRAAESAIRRILAGERSLAYQPGCGTSEVASAATLWVVYVASMVVSLAVAGSLAVSFALGALVFRIWIACETSLGLLAQRLYTVSTAFTSARVCQVAEVARLAGRERPDDETWFEVLVAVERAPSTGGAVAPGALP